MSSYISEHLRQVVALRADHLCEYCLIHEQDTFFGCEVDHIISPISEIGEATARILRMSR
jgi:coproporphyrinogen III oxidase-like Fe-S oxidoreductase